VKGYPTICFNVPVSHARQVLHVSDAQPGSRNDKVGVKGDAFVKAVREDSLYTEFEFNLEGTTQTQRGALILCDGGYCR